MLSVKALLILGKMFNHCSKLKCIPYEFEQRRFKFQVPTNRKKWLFIYFVCVNAHIQTVILISQYFLTKKKSSIHLFRIICNFSGMILNLNLLWNPHKLQSFLNHLFQYVIYFKEKFKVVDPNDAIFDLDGLLSILYKFSLMYSAIVPLQIFRHPTSPRYLYSLFYKINPNPAYIIFFVILDFLYALFTWHVILFNIFVFIAYVSSTNAILDELIGKKIKLHASNEVRSERSSYAVYRCLQILNNHLLASMTQFSLPAQKLACTAITIKLNYMSIRLHNQLPLPAFLIVPVFSFIAMGFLVSVWPTASKVHYKSTKFMRKCASDKKLKKSLYPLRVQFGPFYSLTRFSSVKVFSFTVYWTMKTLLLF